MFVTESWYAIAWGSEIGRQPFARMVCNEPLVLYRTEQGNLVALEDRCCHRRLPLRMGKVIGDNIQCAYHGFTFEPGGQCVKVPGQELIPPSARVRKFAVEDRYSLVWVFLGDAALADPAKIPDYHWITDPEWGAKGSYLHVRANYLLIVENLLDLTHLAFVHATTIGNASVVDSAKVEFKRGSNSVEVRRDIKNCPPPPTYAKAGKFTGNINRFQYINFTPPGYVRLETGGSEVLEPGSAGTPRKITLRNLNLVTPETDTTSHYLWAQCHDFDVKNRDTTEMVFNDVQTAFLQDVEVFEAQQRSISHYPEAPEVDVNGDTGALQARRIVRGILQQQAGGPA